MSLPGTSQPPGLGDDWPRGMTVTCVEVYVDPETRDRLFYVRFDDHEPIMLRVEPVRLAGILASLAKAVARSLH
jgi:hypothetical protein